MIMNRYLVVIPQADATAHLMTLTKHEIGSKGLLRLQSRAR